MIKSCVMFSMIIFSSYYMYKKYNLNINYKYIEQCMKRYE